MTRLLSTLLLALALPASSHEGTCESDDKAQSVQAQVLLQRQKPRNDKSEVLKEGMDLGNLHKDLPQFTKQEEVSAKQKEGSHEGEKVKQKDAIEQEEELEEREHAGGPGAYANFDEAGYKSVADTCCKYQMEEYIRRLVGHLGLEICAEGGLMGMAPWYTCEKGIQSYAALEGELLSKVNDPCAAASTPGGCPTNFDSCPGSFDPTAHRRRSCPDDLPTTTTTITLFAITTRATTTKVPTTTTTITTTTQTTTTKTTTKAPTTTTLTTAALTTTGPTTTTTLTTTTTSTGCKGEQDLITFINANMDHSNLGDAGPDAGPQNMRFAEIGTRDGNSYDLIVETSGAYSAANNSANGFECGLPSAGCISGHFGQISVAAGTSVDLTFSFQDSNTFAPVTLTSFLFSVHDIDQSAAMSEVVYITGFSGIPILANGTEVGVSTEADGRTKLSSTRVGTTADDPDDPLRLRPVTVGGTTIDQKKRSVAFLFEGVSSISMTFEVTGTTPGAGRSFLFSGDTNLVACPGRG